MPTKYDKDVKAKAIRLVRDHAGDYDAEWAVIREISPRLGMSSETLRKWLRQVGDVAAPPLVDLRSAGAEVPADRIGPGRCCAFSASMNG